MNTESSSDTGEYHSTQITIPPIPPLRPPTDAFRVDWSGLTHPGLVRPSNEDHYLLARAGRFLRTIATSLPSGDVPEEFGDVVYATAVADGMGGEAGGEVASRLAISLLVELVLHTPDWVLGHAEPEVERVLERTAERFRSVNEA